MGREILRLTVGDLVQMKKKHPCGTDRFKIVRVGSDVRVLCVGCGRDMTIERVKFEKAVARFLPSAVPGNDTPEGGNT